jgi:hypothetical protein
LGVLKGRGFALGDPHHNVIPNRCGAAVKNLLFDAYAMLAFTAEIVITPTNSKKKIKQHSQRQAANYKNEAPQNRTFSDASENKIDHSAQGKEQRRI